MKLQLSISMLVSDRRNTLERCLNSLLPLLREINSELIVVYTGKEKETLEIVKRYTDQIVLFDWCNDFSKARNVGLEQAKGEWFLYLDDDEWFGDVEEILQFFKSGEYLNYNSASYVQRNYSNWEGTQYGDTFVGRMARVFPDTHFRFPIHECITPYLYPSKNLNSYVHHYGYVKEGEEIPRFDRNVPLLLQGLKENPKSFHYCMQLAQEYKNARNYKKAVYYCKKGLALAKNEETIYSSEYWMAAYLPRFMSLDGKQKQALKEAEKLLLSPRMCDLVSAYLYITLVEVCCDLKEYRKGVDYVRYYQETLEYLCKHPESTECQTGNEFSLSDLKNRSWSLYLNGLVCAMEEDDQELVCDILSWIPWEDENNIKVYYPHLEKWKDKYKEKKGFIQETYYSLESKGPYVNWQKALYAQEHFDLSTTERLWIACAKDYIPEFLAPMIKMAVYNGFSMQLLLEQLSLEVWSSCCVGLSEEVPVEELEDFYDKAFVQIEKYPFYADRLQQGFLEKLLSQGLLEQDKMISLLKRYCDSILKIAHGLYREECFHSKYLECIPAQCRFAILMQNALEKVEENDLLDGIQMMKEALHVYPRMSVAVRHLLMYVKERLEHPEENVSEEFLSMGEQVKEKIKELIEQKQWVAAYSLVSRLSSILPNDLESIRLKQIILTESALPDEDSSSRIYGDYAEISSESVKSFYDSRAKQNGDAPVDRPVVLCADTNPDNIELWAKEELEHWFPMFHLDENSQVFEIGFGTGRMTRYITDKAKEYVGVDYVEQFAKTVSEREDIVKKENTRFYTASLDEFLAKNQAVYPKRFNRVFLSGGVFMYINDDVVCECIANLIPLLQDSCIIYISEPIAIEERLTLKSFYSENMKDYYSAIYRTEKDYEKIFEPLLKEGFTIKVSEPFFKDDIKKQKETKQWIFILER